MQVIAITVEEEEDIAKFKDYKPSKSDAAAAPKEPSTSAPPKEDVPKEPVSSTEPKVSKPTAAKEAGNRIFASPLAKKLAEENNVYNVLLNLNFQQ